MESEKRVGEIDGTWAVAQINRVFNQQMTAVHH
jgi:hypothetical protein